MSSNEPVNLTAQVREKIIAQIESGFQLTDKNKIIDLRKLVSDELKLKSGWRGKVKNMIQDVMIEKNIQIEGMTLGKIKNVKLIKNEFVQPQPQPQYQPQPQSSPETLLTQPQSPRGSLPMGFGQPASPHGTLPKTVTETMELLQGGEGQPQLMQPMTEAQRKTQKAFIVKSFGFVGEIYQAIGLIEGSEEEKEEIKPMAQFKEEVNGFADEVNDFLIDGDVRLPQWANLLTLVVSGFMLFGLPIVKTMFFKPPTDPKKSVKHDESLKDIKVKI